MKTILVAAMLLAGAQLLGQETAIISVRSGELNNGVVILTAQAGQQRLELQCNKGQPSCAALSPGNYVMVRLPKNWDLYECANVDVYRSAASSNERGEKLGQYCLLEK